MFNNTNEYDTFIINLICIKCKLIDVNSITAEQSKFIWLKRYILDSLKWAHADIPAVNQLINNF